MGGAVSPPYSFQHTGPVLVCGNAECLFNDLHRAKSLFGDIPVIAVNGAAKVVRADALYSKHPERFISYRWLEAQKFHFSTTPLIHADTRAATRPSYVDYWWTGVWGGGGSAWDARKLAYFVGYDPIILCGCPLDPGPYTNGGGIGGYMTDAKVVQDLRDGMAKETEWHNGAFSMSGWTKDLLGSC